MKRRTVSIGAAMLVSAGATVIAMMSEFVPLRIWNASASAPLGLYRIARREPLIGEFALLEPSEIVRNLIEERGNLPPDTPLVKRVSAKSGDEICREGARIFINKIVVSYALSEDTAGRPMPQWRGCFPLKYDEVFLLNDPLNSLGGRYFGATKKRDIIGVAIPVWTWEQGQ